MGFSSNVGCILNYLNFFQTTVFNNSREILLELFFLLKIIIKSSMIDNNLKSINQDKTIGIIICRRNNKYLIEYCSDKRIISRECEIK